MPRWTKENWAKLEPDERAVLMETMKGLQSPGFYGGFNVPADVHSCGGCLDFEAHCCCHEIMEALTTKMGVECPDI